MSQRFLEKAIQTGLFSSIDRSDFISLSKWLMHQKQDDANGPIILSSDNNRLRPRESHKLLGELTGCSEHSFVIGPNLLPDGLFDTSEQVNHWRDLSRTYGSKSFNRGRFAFGLDAPDGSYGPRAFRISGLWKNNNADLYPSSATLQYNKPLELLKGKQLYIIWVRYRTENIRDGFPTIRLIDFEDRQILLRNRQLEPTGGKWKEVYTLGYLNGDLTPSVWSLISQYGLRTIWIDYLQIMPVHLGCSGLGGETTIFGEIPTGNEHDVAR